MKNTLILCIITTVVVAFVTPVESEVITWGLSGTIDSVSIDSSVSPFRTGDAYNIVVSYESSTPLSYVDSIDHPPARYWYIYAIKDAVITVGTNLFSLNNNYNTIVVYPGNCIQFMVYIALISGNIGDFTPSTLMFRLAAPYPSMDISGDLPTTLPSRYDPTYSGGPVFAMQLSNRPGIEHGIQAHEIHAIDMTPHDDNHSVPEPATMLLLGFEILGLAGIRRRLGGRDE